MTVYEIVSRVSSGISIVAALFIVVTFGLFPAMRKPMNRLIFVASVGNVVLYVFYCIGTSGIPQPGKSMALCRLQAFSIQTFSTSAMLFTVAMAINVWLIFFRKWAPSELRRLELTYLATIYGFTVLHSLIFLIFDIAPTQSGIYGPANLWCWVTKDYQWIRFTFGYGITWVGCLVITIIYIATGVKILRQNLELKHGNYAIDTPVTVLQVGNPFRPSGRVVCVTEVHVTSSFREPVSPCSTAAESDVQRNNDGKNGTQNEETPGSELHIPHDIRDTPELQQQDLQGPHPTSRANVELDGPENLASQRPGNENEKYDGNLPFSSHQLDGSPSVDQAAQEPARGSSGDSQKMFGIPLPRCLRFPWRLKRTTKLRDPRVAHAREAAMAYAKMSILMFLSLILVWAPASVNRVYLLVNDNKDSTILNTLQAAFNPTQGFCDCIIYVIMSWSSCKTIARDVYSALQGRGEFRPRTVEFEAGSDSDSDAGSGTTLEPTRSPSRSLSI